MTDAPPAAAARRLFGTDGIRGTANTAPMDAATALRLGQAAGRTFNRGTHRHRVVIGKDTRLSGYMMEPALTAGFVGTGMDVVLVGPLPTPAIALLTRSLRADLGVISGEAAAGRRVAPSVAAALFGVARGAAILRVHDVAETVQALRVWRACAAGDIAA